MGLVRLCVVLPSRGHHGIVDGGALSASEREGGDGPVDKVDQVGHPLVSRFTGATLSCFGLPSPQLETESTWYT